MTDHRKRFSEALAALLVVASDWLEDLVGQVDAELRKDSCPHRTEPHTDAECDGTCARKAGPFTRPEAPADPPPATFDGPPWPRGSVLEELMEMSRRNCAIGCRFFGQDVLHFVCDPTSGPEDWTVSDPPKTKPGDTVLYPEALGELLTGGAGAGDPAKNSGDDFSDQKPPFKCTALQHYPSCPHASEERCLDCGHPAYRHYDWAEDHMPGCKYCSCVYPRLASLGGLRVDPVLYYLYEDDDPDCICSHWRRGGTHRYYCPRWGS
jgi:hypothetical protein